VRHAAAQQSPYAGTAHGSVRHATNRWERDVSGPSYEAVPTQYAGVLFRSKSEALFARTLELLGYAWIYEPEWLRCADGYVPDFMYIPAAGDRSFAMDMKIFVTEYKPHRPTHAYLDQLRKHELEIEARSPGWIGMFDCVYGSFFEKAPVLCSVFFDCSGKLIERSGSTHPWCNTATLLEAKRYRFDIDPARAEAGI